MSAVRTQTNSEKWVNEMSTVEIYVEIVRPSKTGKAILFSDGVNEVWLPVSQIEVKHIKDRDYQVTIPVWLARKKGII